MAVIWSRRARDDLAAIFRFIAADNRVAAETWVARLVEKAESMQTMPLAGRIVPEFGRDDVRETFRRSYRIVYQVAGQNIRILTVFEGHRLLRPSDIDDH